MRPSGRVEGAAGKGGDTVGVDAFVDDVQLVMVFRGEDAFLPMRRRDAGIGCFERKQVDCVAGAQAQDAVEAGRVFRVEIHVCSGAPVKELEKADQPGFGQDILDE